jgi:transcription initiation factor TFIIIB Brf1 subunit/transcription initiation factor TFIIB
MDKKICSLCE